MTACFFSHEDRDNPLNQHEFVNLSNIDATVPKRPMQIGVPVPAFHEAQRCHVDGFAIRIRPLPAGIEIIRHVHYH